MIRDFFAGLLFWAMLSAPFVAYPSGFDCHDLKSRHVLEVEMVIDDYFRGVAIRRRQAAMEIASLVVDVACSNGVDPILLAVFVTVESGWTTNAVGAIGERGLLQVHGVAARGHDLTTARGQLEAGASWLSRCVRACGSLLGGMAMYQSGKCATHRGALRRLRIYRDEVDKWR